MRSQIGEGEGTPDREHVPKEGRSWINRYLFKVGRLKLIVGVLMDAMVTASNGSFVTNLTSSHCLRLRIRFESYRMPSPS